MYLIEKVHTHIQKHPEKKALIWVNAKGNEEKTLTYIEFDDAAVRLACALRNEGINRGDTAILCYTPGLDFYLAFWACIRAGIIPVPVSPPLNNSDAKKFLKIFNNSGARVILADKLVARLVTMKIRKHKATRLGKGIASIFRGTNPRTSKISFGDLEKLWWITTSGMSDRNHTVKLVAQPPEKTAFIMYSSGSTSSPKGALTTLINLKHQFEIIEQACGASPDNVCCWWAPHFHDFGLISGFLNCLDQGCTSVITSPMFFIQRPALWLDMIHNFRATHTFGPDFGYLLLIRKTSQEEREIEKWNLRSLKVAMSAAEKVRYNTLTEFAEAFAPCGFQLNAFCPAYGLAEHSVGVTINSSAKNPMVLWLRRRELEEEGKAIPVDDKSSEDQIRVKQLVGSGTPWHNTTIRIVKLDEDGNPLCLCPDNQVGEIWASSLSKTLGYHKMPDITEEVFRARLPDVSPDSNEGKLEYLRTGDLGFIDEESRELFICGRNKDMLIIAGKNHYSEDMELNIAEELSDYLRPGCIAALSFEAPHNQQEKLAIVAEVKRKKINLEDCFRRIQECIAREHHIVVSRILLISQKAIPKTSSGKIRRFVLRKQINDDQLKTIPGGNWVNLHDEDSFAEEKSEVVPITNEKYSEVFELKVKTTDPLTAKESDFPKLLLDFENFVTHRGIPSAFPVYFPECGREFENWFFLVGTDSLALLFDEEKFYRMPVWNFTSVDPSLFDHTNFPRWANGETHRNMKIQLASIIDGLLPHTIERSTKTSKRFLNEWTDKRTFPWLFALLLCDS